MRLFLGIDTSNYTTSCAFFQPETGCITQNKKLLPVKAGELGLRQSDAVFHHVQQLPELFSGLREQNDGEIAAIGVSVRPRPVDGSYMPCFEVGRSAAETLGAALGVPVFPFSHQEGHIRAAMFGAGCAESLPDRFVAFHVSGGTTEALLVTRKKAGFDAELIACSLDLKAGQAVDRVAGMLSLPFPGGACLEKLALENTSKISVRPCIKGLNCCLSGIENLCRKELDGGAEHSRVAAMCIEFIRASLQKMTEGILGQYGDLPLLYAGGVMSCSIIRKDFEKRFGAYFAPPEYSCDNAAGIALLCHEAFSGGHS